MKNSSILVDKKPTVSIVIPCHNESKYIGRLLTDILNQGIEKDSYEVIVVDNRSTDETNRVVWEFSARNRDMRIRIVHEYLLGVSRARNTGGKLASGELIVFLDADNRVDDEFVASLATFCTQKKSVAGTFRTLPDCADIKGSFVFWMLEFIKTAGWRPFGKSFVDREVFHRIGGFNEEIVLGENVDFLVRAKRFVRSAGGSFCHVRKPVFCSLRRFEKQGYLKTLLPWLLAYFGWLRLKYKTMTSLDNIS